MQGRTCALVDLFDPLHARKVLAAFGRAYGRLPEATRLTPRTGDVPGPGRRGSCAGRQDHLRSAGSVRRHAQGQALDHRHAVASGRHRGSGCDVPGGDVQRFDRPRRSSPPPAGRPGRPESPAARGGQRYQGQPTIVPRHLLDASGYAQRPGDFADLIQILDSEIRLITPTVPAGEEVGARVGAGAGESAATIAQPVSAPEKYYQLTHDYLVPSLRDWLTRKQKETRRGRAELRLAERSALWNAKPENQQLPSWWEDLSIRWLTDHKKWTDPQRRMMRRATRVYGMRSILVLASLVALGFIRSGRSHRGCQAAGSDAYRGLVGRLVSAEPGQVPDIVKKLDTNPDVAATYLVAPAHGTGRNGGRKTCDDCTPAWRPSRAIHP